MGFREKMKNAMNSSQRDGVNYRTASWGDIICSMAHNGVGMCFYMLIMYASYIGTEGYGIGVVLCGAILTATKAFDGVTDAIAAIIYERIPSKHGKIRIMAGIGWIVEALAVLILYNFGAGKFTGVAGVVAFTVVYVIYTLGYTLVTICAGTASTVITNDPLQRPMVAFFDTMFSYATPQLLGLVLSFWVLPIFDNQYSAEMLKNSCWLYVGVSFVLLMVTFYGVRKVDVHETFAALGDEEDEKIGFKDMWHLFKENKPVQMYIITVASDKLAQSTASQPVVNVMLAGILIGSYKATTLIGTLTSVIGLAFAFLGGLFVAKYGSRVSTKVWSIVSIALSFLMVGFIVILGTDGMKQIGAFSVPMVIYVVIQLAITASKMILSATANAMRADIVDYELYRSGKYMPAVVNGAYSFINKLIASFASTIAAVCIAMIGYKNTMPQMGDKASNALFWMTMFLCFGMPVLGWVLNVVAMKFYKLDKATMVEVQKGIQDKKEAIKAEKTA